MNIVILDGYTENPGDLSWNALEKLGNCTIYDRTPAEAVQSRIGDAEIVLTNKTPLSKEVIENCPRLQYIGVLATGYNIVDVKAAKAKNIPVCNVPAYSTGAVAQLTMALLLELCHHVGEHNRSVQSGDWSRSPDFCYWNYPLTELAGKVIGIVGCGQIGIQTGKLAAAFGMEVLAYDHHLERKTLPDNFRGVSLEELFAASDVISLHCPLTETSRNLIRKDSIEKMKDGVWILNTARGPLIQEQELREALDSGKVGGAAVDVASTEPIPEDSPLLGAPNCIITPHIAWAPKESRKRLMDITVENIRQFLAGHPIHIVYPLEEEKHAALLDKKS